MNTEASEPIELRKDQLKPASMMLERAFRDDPVTRYSLADQYNADGGSHHGYEFLLRLYFGYAVACTTSERLEGIALWQLYPRKAKTSFWRAITPGVIWQTLRMGNKAVRRMRVLDQCIEKKHAELMPAPHWYLAILGVDPEFQGQGYASLLLRGKLSRIDAERLPCFLETTTEKNVAIYQHFGFKVIDEYTLPDSSVKFWAMLRETSY